mgnify:CR=1 FL=1
MSKKGVLLLTVLDAVSFIVGGVLATLSYMRSSDPTHSLWPWLIGSFALMSLIMTLVGFARLSRQEPL